MNDVQEVNQEQQQEEKAKPTVLRVKTPDGDEAVMYFNKFVENKKGEKAAWFSAKNKESGDSLQAFVSNVLKWGQKAAGEEKVSSWNVAYGTLIDGKLAWGKGGSVDVGLSGPQGRELFDFVLGCVKADLKEYRASRKAAAESAEMVPVVSVAPQAAVEETKQSKRRTSSLAMAA